MAVFVPWILPRGLSLCSQIYEKETAPSLGWRFEHVFWKVLKYRGSCTVSEDSSKDMTKRLLIFGRSQGSAGRPPEPRDFFREGASAVQMSDHWSVPRSEPGTGCGGWRGGGVLEQLHTSSGLTSSRSQAGGAGTALWSRGFRVTKPGELTTEVLLWTVFYFLCTEQRKQS